LKPKLHKEFSQCDCKSRILTKEEVRMVCRVLEGEHMVRIWVGEIPDNLGLRIAGHSWDDTRRVKWKRPLRLWDKRELEDTIAAYNAGLMYSSVPRSVGTHFYNTLLKHIRKSINQPLPTQNLTLLTLRHWQER
jgi:uncharacterized protein (DUF2164 family)